MSIINDYEKYSLTRMLSYSQASGEDR